MNRFGLFRICNPHPRSASLRLVMRITLSRFNAQHHRAPMVRERTITLLGSLGVRMRFAASVTSSTVARSKKYRTTASGACRKLFMPGSDGSPSFKESPGGGRIAHAWRVSIFDFPNGMTSALMVPTSLQLDRENLLLPLAISQTTNAHSHTSVHRLAGRAAGQSASKRVSRSSIFAGLVRLGFACGGFLPRQPCFLG